MSGFGPGGIFIGKHGESRYAVPIVTRKEGLRELSENNTTDEKILSMTSAEW